MLGVKGAKFGHTVMRELTKVFTNPPKASKFDKRFEQISGKFSRQMMYRILRIDERSPTMSRTRRSTPRTGDRTSTFLRRPHSAAFWGSWFDSVLSFPARCPFEMSKRDLETRVVSFAPPPPPRSSKLTTTIPPRKPRSPPSLPVSKPSTPSGYLSTPERGPKPAPLSESPPLSDSRRDKDSEAGHGNNFADLPRDAPDLLQEECSPGKTDRACENGAGESELTSTCDPALLRKISFGKVSGLDAAIAGAAVSCNAVACPHGQKEQNWLAVCEEVKVFARTVPDVAQLLNEKKVRDRYRRLFSNLPKLEQQFLRGECSADDVELLKNLQAARDVLQADAAKRAERPSRKRRRKSCNDSTRAGVVDAPITPALDVFSQGVPLSLGSVGVVNVQPVAGLGRDGGAGRSNDVPRDGRLFAAPSVPRGMGKSAEAEEAADILMSTSELSGKVAALGSLAGGGIDVRGPSSLELGGEHIEGRLSAGKIHTMKENAPDSSVKNSVDASLLIAHQSQGSLRTELESVKVRLTGIEAKLDRLLAAMLG